MFQLFKIDVKVLETLAPKFKVSFIMGRETPIFNISVSKYAVFLEYME